jgi:hypothetical protein
MGGRDEIVRPLRLVSRRQERGQSGQRLRQLGQESAVPQSLLFIAPVSMSAGGFRFLRAVPTRPSVHVIEALRD